MAGDNTVEIKFTASVDQLSTDLEAVTSKVTSSANEMSSALSEMGASASSTASVASQGFESLGRSAERGSIGMKGFHVAGHELFMELGAGGPIARTLGLAVERMAESFGAAAPILGAFTLAAIAGTAIWEHFSGSSERAQEQIQKTTSELSSEIDAIYKNTDQTKGLTEAREKELHVKMQIAALTLATQMKEEGEMAEELRQRITDLTGATNSWGILGHQMLMGLTRDWLLLKNVVGNGALFSPEGWSASMKETEAQLDAMETKEILTAKEKLATLNASLDVQKELIKLSGQKALPAEKTAKKPESNMSEYDEELKQHYVDLEAAGNGYRERDLEYDLAYWQKKKELAESQNNTSDIKGTYGKILDAQLALGKQSYDLNVQMLNDNIKLQDKGSQEQVDAVKLLEDYLLQHHKEGSTKILAVEQELTMALKAQADKRTADAQKAEAERQREVIEMAKATTKNKEAEASDMMKLEVMKADQMRSMGLISGQQRLEMDKTFADQELKIKVDALNAEIEQLAATDNFTEAKYVEMYGKIEAANRAHALQMQKIDDQITQQEMQRWQQMGSSIVNSINSMATGVITGQENVNKAMQKLYLQLTQAFIQMVEKMIEEWLMQEAITGLTSLGLIGGGALGGFESAGNVFVGGAGSERGWDVPSFAYGGNIDTDSRGMLSLLHPKEMVLPANLAEGVRNMVSTGDEGKSGDTHFHFSPMVSAFDSKDVGRMMADNRGPIVKSFNKMVRDGHLKPKR